MDDDFVVLIQTERQLIECTFDVHAEMDASVLFREGRFHEVPLDEAPAFRVIARASLFVSKAEAKSTLDAIFNQIKDKYLMLSCEKCIPDPANRFYEDREYGKNQSRDEVRRFPRRIRYF